MSNTQIGPDEFNYQITVNDTGSTTIGTFWFSWIPGAGFMPAAATDIMSPAGWTETVTNGGKSIRWVDTTDPIEPGDSLSGFSFDSTVTPAEFKGIFTGTGLGAGDPILTTTVYAGAPLVGADSIFLVTETPEPCTLPLTITGLGLAAAFLAFRLRRGDRKTAICQLT
ncbi:MAG: hypothetical protein ACRD3S_16810 [Terracidiphilus sp.]